MSTQETIESVREAFRTDSKLVAKDPDKYESLKIKFLGRMKYLQQGELTQLVYSE